MSYKGYPETVRLFDIDSEVYEFTSKVISCEPSAENEGLFELILESTCFFPEGGGQAADAGSIGGAAVADVQEKGRVIVHYVGKNFGVGETVRGVIDSGVRFNRMQNHSGEHILSGLAHNKYGCANVGFHLTDTIVTIDFDKFLDRDQLLELEADTNRIITENRKITAVYPDPEILKTLEYRSKLELTENVRIVTIEGVDMCACCAPHVKTTGEIGIMKILGSIHYKGGVRLEIVSGAAALREFERRYKEDYEISQLLTAPQEELASAVKKQLGAKEELKVENSVLKHTIAVLTANAARGQIVTGSETVTVTLPFKDVQALRDTVNSLTPLTTGAVAAICTAGENTYQYIIGCSVGGLRAKAKDLNIRLNGKGGGSEQMIQGTFNASEDDINKTIKEIL